MREVIERLIEALGEGEKAEAFTLPGADGEAVKFTVRRLNGRLTIRGNRVKIPVPPGSGGGGHPQPSKPLS